MSQAKNKVDWCLKKAKKELEASSKHRGLVEIKPDVEEAKRHIIKAEHNFKALLSMERGGFSDWSVSAAFYVIYHSFLAIITKFGYESRNQECTFALVEYLKESGKITLSDDLLKEVRQMDITEHDSAVALREDFQYGTATSIESKRLEELKQLCSKAIEETKAVVYK